MGAGRKTHTLLLKEKSKARQTINCSVSARNLSKSDLGAVIFGCKHHTITECKMKQLFGLPFSHFSYVKNVSPGLTLFLFNYNDRKLHGIFEAASPGQLNINPYGWTVDGEESTPYPAQVRIRVRGQCRTLREDEFGPAIADNYYEQSLFWFELDHTQTRKLIDLFLSSPSYNLASPVRNAAKWNTFLNRIPSSDSKEASAGVKDGVSVDNQHKVAIGQVTWTSAHKETNHGYERSYASVLGQSNTSVPKNSTASQECLQIMDTREKGECSKSVALDLHLQQSCVLKMGWESSCSTKGCDGGSQPSKVSMDNDENEMRSDVGIHEGEIAQPLNAIGENLKETKSSVALAVEEFRSTDIQSFVAQLMREIGEMKGLQLKQNQKINSLEQELAQSKLEIQQLRNQYNMLASRQTASSSGQFEGINFEPFDGFPEFDDSIVIVGGYDGSSWLTTLSSYSPSSDLIKSLTPMPFVRSYTSAAKLNGELYLFGGAHDDVWYDTVESYNLRSNQWSVRPPLNQKKGSLAGISVFEKLFAIGGGNGVECFAEVEMFDMNVGKWICIQPMQQKRFAPAVADINGTLYVVGGYTGRDYLKSVERFDPREHTWTRIASLNTRRGCHSLVALNGKLYALGGFDGEKMVSTVEVFDPRACSWMIGESMKAARGYSGAAVIGEKIYVIGGVERGEEILDTVECYKEGYGWQLTNLKAVGKRCFFSALAL